jgi:hypothetical protein
MISIKGIIDKVAGHKLAVIAVAGAAAATGAVKITLADGGYSDGVYRRADGSGYVGRVRRGTGKRKRGSSHLRRSPSYIFMLLYQDERLLIGVLHSCYIIR